MKNSKELGRATGVHSTAAAVKAFKAKATELSGAVNVKRLQLVTMPVLVKEANKLRSEIAELRTDAAHKQAHMNVVKKVKKENSIMKGASPLSMLCCP